jgi:hypothetical protein
MIAAFSGVGTILAADAPPRATQPHAAVVLPSSLRAYDHPSDDGSAIVVEWPRPDDEPEGTVYVVEIAASAEDLAEGKSKVAIVQASPDALKSATPKFFAATRQNKQTYFVAISPAELLGSPKAERTADKLKRFVEKKLITPKDRSRAGAILADGTAAAMAIMAREQKAGQGWVAGLFSRLIQLRKLAVERKADLEWLDGLMKRLTRLENLGKSARRNLVTPEELARAGEILQRETLAEKKKETPEEKDETPEEKAERLKQEAEQKAERLAQQADRKWVDGLESRVALRAALRGYAEKKLVPSPEEVARAETILTDDTPAGKMTPEQEADQAWLGVLMAYLTHRAGLDGLVEQEVLTAEQFDRAVRGLKAQRVPDEESLTREQRGDLAWVKRLSAHLSKRKSKIVKAEAAEVNGATYFLRLGVVTGKGEAERIAYVTGSDGPEVVSAAARANLFKGFKLNNLIFAMIFSGIVLVFIQLARRNPNLFIRKIAGLEAVEEAIGRATEMGRSVYFVHGLGTVSGLSTIAALNILARVARRAAEYDTRVKVMNYDPIVTAVSQEVVQQAYTEAGRPDAYDPDDVSLVAYDQFSYVAAVGGRMVREQPAAIFLIGYFYAESLLLAETGASTGAIQVAGTDAYTQLPFFVTTCDYTLIGEELFAASAYLSREPRMLGSLRGQDVGKAFLMATMILGVAIMTAAQSFGWSIEWFRTFLRAF